MYGFDLICFWNNQLKCYMKQHKTIYTFKYSNISYTYKFSIFCHCSLCCIIDVLSNASRSTHHTPCKPWLNFKSFPNSHLPIHLKYRRDIQTTFTLNTSQGFPPFQPTHLDPGWGPYLGAPNEYSASSWCRFHDFQRGSDFRRVLKSSRISGQITIFHLDFPE